MDMDKETPLKLTQAELLVLDNFFSRLADIAKEDSILDGKPLFQSKAEMGALWNLQCVLEKTDKDGDLEEAKKHILRFNFGEE